MISTQLYFSFITQQAILSSQIFTVKNESTVLTYIKNVWISPRKSAKNILTINWSLSYLLFVQKDVKKLSRYFLQLFSESF